MECVEERIKIEKSSVRVNYLDQKTHFFTIIKLHKAQFDF